jgi:hypothetical protein
LIIPPVKDHSSFQIQIEVISGVFVLYLFLHKVITFLISRINFRYALVPNVQLSPHVIVAWHIPMALGEPESAHHVGFGVSAGVLMALQIYFAGGKDR